MNIFQEKNVECILITSEYNRAWLCDYQSTMGYIFWQPKKITCFYDARYYTEAKEKLRKIPNTEVILFKSNDQLIEFIKNLNVTRIGYEDFYTTVFEFEKLIMWFKFKNLEWVPVGGPEFRKVKLNYEIARIEKAIDISLLALHNIKNKIIPGITEKDIEIELVTEMMRLGAEKPSFDTIVVSGDRGAIPHGKPTNKIIEDGEWLTIDFGARYKNYCADITRTFQLRHKNWSKIPIMTKIFNIVKEAQKRGIQAVRPGVTCKSIDDICRQYIIDSGYGDYFGHGTGHGLGVEIHEEPYISPLNKTGILQVGNVITVEPGIYIPGLGGVRLEDNILVTENGYRQLGKNVKLIEEDFYD